MMKTSFFDQVTKAVTNHVKRSRWVSVVLCLALVVSTGTFYTLIRQGQAKVRSEKLLVCDFVPHEHTDECFGRDEFGEIDESVILCGMEDYVIHTHTDDCYDKDGHLVCELEEIEAHEHDANCYEVTEELICDHVEQAGGHQHTDECYEEREITDEAGTETEAVAENTCTLEEHTHTDECYTEEETAAGEPVLTCTEGEHTHDDSCYTERTEMTCTESEHSHSDSCYTPVYSNELTCSDDSEEHSHDSGCYSEVQTGTELSCGQSEHSHGDGCYETVRELTCGESEHTHSDSCYSAAEAGTHKVLSCGKAEHTHDANCSGSGASDASDASDAADAPRTERVLICGKEENVPEEVHHDESCYRREETLICGKEEHIVHVHDEKCYRDPEEGEEVPLDEDGNELPGILICEKRVLPEHIHNSDCFVKVTVGVEDPQYICGKLSHTHAEGCYGTDESTGESILRCPLEEHTHGDTCLASMAGNWICGKEAHKHDDSCMVNGELACGLEEHEHSDECLPEPEWLCGKLEHTHDETCRNADGELVCPLEEHTHTGLCMTANAAPDWQCGKIAHTHGDACYNENGELTCELPEHEHTDFCLLREDEVSWLCGKTSHKHDESCYDENGVLTCGLEEHEHTPECLVDHDIEWFCGKTEHTHSAACYDETGALVCGLEEHTHDARCLVAEIKDEDCICGISAHTHGDDCYDADGSLVCELEEHVHTIDCLAPAGIEWLCGKTAHTHGADCYDADGSLVCGLEEHLHTAACLVEQDGRWLCGKTEHTHGDACYDADGNLICDLEEHTHTDECLLVPETVLVAHDHNYTTTSGYFDITFNVEGPAILRRDPASMVDNEPAEEVVPVEDEEDYDVFLFGDDETETESADPAAAPEEAGTETAEPAPEETGTETEEAAPVEDAAAVTGDSGHEFRFQIDALEETSDSYIRFLQTAEENGETLLDTVSVKMYCDDVRLDLTDCKITATVRPTELLREMLAKARAEAAAAKAAEEESVTLAGFDEDAGEEEPAAETKLPNPENIVLNISVREIKSDNDVDTLGTMVIDKTADVGDDIATLAVFEETDVASEEDNSTDVISASEKENSTDVTSGAQNSEEEDSFDEEVVSFAMENDEAGISAQTDNATFTVEYYAYMDRLVTSKNDYGQSTSELQPLDVINTSGGKMPTNGYDYASNPIPGTALEDGVIQIYVGKGETADKGKVLHAESQLTPLFKAREFPGSYAKYDGNTLWDIIGAPSKDLPANKIHYTKGELWVIELEKFNKLDDAGKLEKKNWEIYDLTSSVTFTDDPDKKSASVVCISPDYRYRMVYNPKNDAFGSPTKFHDYDISDGFIYTGYNKTTDTFNGQTKTSAQTDTETWYANTWQQGINSHSTDQSKVYFGFGNGETNTRNGWSTEEWNGNYLNKANRDSDKNDKAYKGCTFGLVTGFASKDKVTFASDIEAPDLFSTTSIKGKTSYEGSLTFDRKGDTYTLMAANVIDKQKGVLTTGDLNKLDDWYSGTTIYSNEFWPLDHTSSHGTDNHDLKFGLNKVASKRISAGGGSSGSFPAADQPKDTGTDHNCYFGMNFAVDFEVMKNYLGPLEYVFFGDDDLWVFLISKDGKDSGLSSGKLICDIGGVHSSVGEYVNLKDYIKTSDWGPDEEKRAYTLYFFYTERGASGSTCWMQFTLPQITTRLPEEIPDEYTLDVNKEVVGGDTTEEFEFTIDVDVRELSGVNQGNRYQFIRCNTAGDSDDGIQWILTSGGQGSLDFKMRHGDTITVLGLPKGAKYTVTEKITGAYVLQKLQDDGTTTDLESHNKKDKDGNDVKDKSGNPIKVAEVGGSLTTPGITEIKLINRFWPQMPATGGPGTTAYSIAGAVLLTGGLLLALRKKKKEE